MLPPAHLLSSMWGPAYALGKKGGPACLISVGTAGVDTYTSRTAPDPPGVLEPHPGVSCLVSAVGVSVAIIYPHRG